MIWYGDSFFFVGAVAAVFGQGITQQQYCGTVLPVNDHYTAIEYSIYYPPSWTLDTSGLLETQFIVTSPKDNEEDAFRENVSLRVKDSKNLHDFVVGSENWLRNNGHLLESRRRINEARQEYHLVVYTLNEQPDLLYEQYYFFKFGFLYELTFVYERAHFFENRTNGEDVLNSFGFKFNDHPPTPPVFIMNFR